MQVILLERVAHLGQMGDIVDVKPGYARNFLLPREKALRATNENKAFFETQKKVLEGENLKRKTEAEKVAKKVEGLKIILIRQASEAGSLYGSVTSRDIAKSLEEKGFKIDRSQVLLDRNYKILGLYPIKISLHPEVDVDISLNIARSAEEAKIQEEKGEALITQEVKEKKEPLSPEPEKAKKAKVKKESSSKAEEDTTEKTEKVEEKAEEATDS